jgi:hypothetical protein
MGASIGRSIIKYGGKNQNVDWVDLFLFCQVEHEVRKVQNWDLFFQICDALQW